ncbi:MAG: hydroxymethylbilane synthase [Abyssibacter sp.]|uniref:hydroxymethylbilane synthase n=1 Tax=Abyssibacter sp. TaxID=2320200 RepID=UPI00321C2A98
MKLVIATRQSPLALWQAEHVRDRLLAQHAGLQVELLKLTTEGDRRLDAPLAAFGGKGLFIKELEQALLDGRADLAVHSMKDVPVTLPDGFALGPILQRADVRDALVMPQAADLDGLPQGARIGTASQRRQAQLAARRPDLSIHPVRGNVGTRLQRLDEGRFQALVLAAAGLDRLGLAARITQRLDPADMLPAVGQGAVGIEYRAGDEQTAQCIAPLNHPETALCVRAERALSLALGGDCTLPLAGYAELDGEQLSLRAFMGMPDGSAHARWQGQGLAADPEALGQAAAEGLRAAGATAILERLRAQ